MKGIVKHKAELLLLLKEHDSLGRSSLMPGVSTSPGDKMSQRGSQEAYSPTKAAHTYLKVSANEGSCRVFSSGASAHAKAAPPLHCRCPTLVYFKNIYMVVSEVQQVRFPIHLYFRRGAQPSAS